MRARWQRLKGRYPRSVLAGVGITLIGIVLDLIYHVWLIRYDDSYNLVASSGHLATGLGVAVAIVGICLIRRCDQPPADAQEMASD